MSAKEDPTLKMTSEEEAFYWYEQQHKYVCELITPILEGVGWQERINIELQLSNLSERAFEIKTAYQQEIEGLHKHYNEL